MFPVLKQSFDLKVKVTGILQTYLHMPRVADAAQKKPKCHRRPRYKLPCIWHSTGFLRGLRCSDARPVDVPNRAVSRGIRRQKTEFGDSIAASVVEHASKLEGSYVLGRGSAVICGVCLGSTLDVSTVGTMVSNREQGLAEGHRCHREGRVRQHARPDSMAVENK